MILVKFNIFLQKLYLLDNLIITAYIVDSRQNNII